MTSTPPATEWAPPLEYAAALEHEEHLVLLHSGMEPGRFSFLAWGLAEETKDIKNFGAKLQQAGGKFDNIWFGWLGYGLRHLNENLPRTKGTIIPLPEFLMMKFNNLMVFDHSLKTIISFGKIPAKKTLTPAAASIEGVLQSNMSDAEFMSKTAEIIEKINNGDLYQANLTRKFFGRAAQNTNKLALFARLCEISPAPYSAFIRYGDYCIISASPEKYLSAENGIATTTPIKGTLPAESPAALLSLSEKDRAENLMIVDLMRNDLSRTCSNVKVSKLFEVTSYAKYHHMSSTITGEMQKPALDVALSCFPPGSMTGAPKIHAMRLINGLEATERGVYSGAIGYFSGDGSCDLSVVIRTLVFAGDDFEFQVGGGIVADSKPENELEETHTKARAIMEVLGISVVISR